MERPPFSRLSAIAARKAKVLSLRAFLTRLIWLCVLPLLLLAIYIAVNHVETLQAQRDEEASDQALNVATAIDRQIKEQIAALEMLAASPLLDDPLRLNEFYNQARVFRESFGGHVILADLSMQMLLHTREPFGAVLPKLPQPSGHAAAPAVLETGKPAVGDMFFGPIAKEPLVAVAAPVIRDDRTRLLLLSIIETRQFQRRLDEVSLRVGWSLTVLDGKNEIMARGSSSEMEGLHSGKEPAERFIAKSAVSHWSVVLEVPRSVYRGPIVAATAALAVTILAATLFSVLGGRLAAHRLARSVTSLAETSPNASSRPTIAEIEAVRQTLKEAAAAQKSAESTLRESEERFAKAFENSPDAITITAVADGRLIDVNQALTRLSGYSREECIGRTSIELNLWANPAGRDYYVAKLREKGRVLNLEADFRTQSGEIRNCLVSGEFVEIQGAPHILGVIRDITERKRAEEEIRQLNEMLEQRVKDRTAELEEANRDLESFSYSVSHDLRAPLRAISGFAEIIARRHRASLNEEGQRYFDNIIEGSAQMGRLIDDLLKYSRLGRRALSLQAVNPLVILRQVTKTLADRIEGLGAKIVIPGTIPAVQGDPTLVEQIFANLVENALLYRRSGVAPIVEVTGTAADGHVVIEVSDNGIGISPEYHQKIFNMFQRLHSYDDYPGTGIGLAIVRKSANLMDGDVWVESEPGCGSRFFVKLIQAKKPAETE